MKFYLHFGDNVPNVCYIPPEALGCDDATAEALRVLLYILARANVHPDAEGRVFIDIDRHDMADFLELDSDVVAGAIEYWKGAKILRRPKAAVVKKSDEQVKIFPDKRITISEPEPVKKQRSPEPPAPLPPPTALSPAPLPPAALPTYNGREVERAKSELPWVDGLLCELQNDMGLLTPTECAKIVATCDYFKLDAVYMLTLTAYLATKTDRLSAAYLIKVAERMFHDDITTADALERHIREADERSVFEGKIRTMFGLVGSFTKAQRDYIARWKDEHDIALVELAHDITVDNTGKPIFKYADKILQSWAQNGIKTKADYEKSLAAEPAKPASDVYEEFRREIEREKKLRQRASG